jgi:hypothetical protein
MLLVPDHTTFCATRAPGMDGRLIRLSISAFGWVSVALAVPRGFPASGNALWYSTPGNVWSKSWLPIGNGYLGGMFLYTL